MSFMKKSARDIAVVSLLGFLFGCSQQANPRDGWIPVGCKRLLLETLSLDQFLGFEISQPMPVPNSGFLLVIERNPELIDPGTANDGKCRAVPVWPG